MRGRSVPLSVFGVGFWLGAGQLSPLVREVVAAERPTLALILTQVSIKGFASRRRTRALSHLRKCTLTR